MANSSESCGEVQPFNSEKIIWCDTSERSYAVKLTLQYFVNEYYCDNNFIHIFSSK